MRIQNRDFKHLRNSFQYQYKLSYHFQLVFGVAGLLAGFIAIATLINQADQLQNICEAVSIKKIL